VTPFDLFLYTVAVVVPVTGSLMALLLFLAALSRSKE